ncbi:hypothetical protein SAMN05428959_1011128 [Duganella sp. CF517]|nr:hypothetical protein SAMN05428959_1011128 [Duganella sp. CF517]
MLPVGQVADGHQRPIWRDNGDPMRPTFTPSVLARNGHRMDRDKKECWCNFEQRTGRKSPFKCGICHSFVTAGRIQFLSDSTHELAWQTFDLPDWS